MTAEVESSRRERESLFGRQSGVSNSVARATEKGAAKCVLARTEKRLGVHRVGKDRTQGSCMSQPPNTVRE